MRPIHFDVTAEDPQKLIKFYQAVFGWKFAKVRMSTPRSGKGSRVTIA